MTGKTCTRCTRELPVDAFPKRRGRGKERSPWCRNCMAAFHADRQRVRAGKRPMHGPVRKRLPAGEGGGRFTVSDADLDALFIELDEEE